MSEFFAKAKIGWCINCEFIFKKLCKCSISTKTFKPKVTLMETEFLTRLFSFLAIWCSALFDWTDESSHAYTAGTLPKINLLKDILFLYFVEYWGVLTSFKIKSGLSLWLRTKFTRDTFDNEDFRQIFTSISSVSKLKNVVGLISNNKHVR